MDDFASQILLKIKIRFLDRFHFECRSQKIHTLWSVYFLSIAKAMAYHQQRLAVVVSHQSVRTVYHHALACIKTFRNDDIQNFVLMICNPLRN